MPAPVGRQREWVYFLWPFILSLNSGGQLPLKILWSLQDPPSFTKKGCLTCCPGTPGTVHKCVSAPVGLLFAGQSEFLSFPGGWMHIPLRGLHAYAYMFAHVYENL